MICTGVWTVFNARSLCNKLDELHLFLHEQNVDVCCVSETWLTAAVPDSLICPSNYTIFRHDRPTPGGGVAIFVKKAIDAVVVDIPAEFSHIEVICVDLLFSTTNCRVICFYRRPGFSDIDISYMNDCVQCFKKLCSTEKLVVITGDCNLPDINWSFYHSPNSTAYNTFMDFVNNYGFHQYVDQPTRDNKILDIVMATSDTFLEDLTVCAPLGTSDHNTVIFKTNVLIETKGSSSSAPYFDFAHADYNAINRCLSVVDWNAIFSRNVTVEDSWCVFHDILTSLFNLYVPIRHGDASTYDKHNKIRYPRYIKLMLKRKAVLWKKWTISKLSADKTAYKAAVASCRSAIDKYHAAKELSLIRKNNLGSFYKFVNSKLKSKTVAAALKTSSGSVTQDANEKAEVFSCFFSSVFTRDNGFCPDVDSRVDSDHFDGVLFTPAIVREVLRKLKPTTSAGSDGIPNLFLKKCANFLAIPLCHIFSNSFLDGCLPNSWKHAVVTPVHKQGPTSDPNNFRPISLTATCCKVMERIINNEILRYLFDRRLITRQQHGFIKRKSVSSNLLECLEDWTLNLQAKCVTDVIYFDFRKAFDTVCHSKLLVKLHSYGISGNLLAWIEAFLCGRTQSVRIDQKISAATSVISGVPQGSVLGPTLFLLYINDVADIFSDLCVSFSLFADDLKLFTSYKLDASHTELQLAIDRLSAWSGLWQMEIAVSKCSAFRISNPQWKVSCDLHNSAYNINSNNLPFSDCIRDLGVYHDGRLKYDQHISFIVRKAFNRAVLILKCFHSRNSSVLMQAFSVYVRPLLEFSSSVWSPHYKYLIDKIESVQRFFTKHLSGLHDLSYHDRLSFLGFETLERRRLVLDLVLCYKILNGLCDISLPFKLAHSSTRGHSLKLVKPNCSNDVRKYFFTSRVIDVWNSLSEDIVKSPSVAVFKKTLRSVNFNTF